MRAAAMIAPLEGMRRGLWRLTARTGFGRRCIREPALRLQILAIAHVAVGCLVAAIAPAWLLLLSPLLLGVPHLAADLRYLVIRPPFPLPRPWLLLAPLGVMVAARALSYAGLPWSPQLEVGLGLLSVAAVLAVAPLSPLRRGLGLGLTGLALLAIWPAAGLAILLFAHLHNLIAFFAWLHLYRREASPAQTLSVALAYAAAIALLMSGALDGLMAGLSLGAFSVEGMRGVLAPGLSPELGTRLVVTYAFAQAFHYVIWLRLIPQSLDPRPAPPTLQRSLSRLRADFGSVGFFALAALVVAVPVLAIAFDAGLTRHAYLVAAVFHGWLELAIFAALLVGAGGFASSRGRRHP